MDKTCVTLSTYRAVARPNRTDLKAGGTAPNCSQISAFPKKNYLVSSKHLRKKRVNLLQMQTDDFVGRPDDGVDNLWITWAFGAMVAPS